MDLTAQIEVEPQAQGLVSKVTINIDTKVNTFMNKIK
jgi:hypothetical protein